MKVNRISVSGFRNIESAEVEFCDGVNLLLGDNAQGKTNLLEAIYYMSLGKSFRGAAEVEMIGFGKDFASVSLDFNDSLREQNLTVRISRDKRRRFEQNGVKIFKMSDIVGALRAVLFSPDNLSLIKDGPSERRNWLDVAICQSRPLYMQALSRFNKILKQRNKLLKDAEDDRRTFDDTIGFWSEQLARESAILTGFRNSYTAAAGGDVARFFSEMTGDNETPVLRYVSSCKLDTEECRSEAAVFEAYSKLLTSNLEREIAVGSTLWGAHKDDIDITLNSKSARDYASQGQQRSLALAMKLAEGEICRRECGEYPIFLLDDVLSELDTKRRAYLLSEISGRQVIMTGCDDQSTGSANVIRVESGTYRKI